ncbi:hypothetical protein P3L10_003507 [Capsicum annuum]
MCQTYTCDCFCGDEKQREVHVSQYPSATIFHASKQAYSGHNYATGSSNYLAGPSKQPFGGQRPNYDRKNIAEGKKNTSGLFCSYCKRTNHTVENCYRLIGFPADFKFTKSKRLGPSAKSNVAYSLEENGGNSGDKPMTQDQYNTLYQLLQHVKLGAEVSNNTEEATTVNCAGPFNEEAIVSW